MNVPRINHTATLLSNGEVLVAGGNNNTHGYLSSAEVYNPSTGKWTLTGSMTVPRDGHDAVLLQNGQVLVAGGLNASSSGCTTLAAAELYNPSTGTWTETGSMSVGRYSFTLTLLSNGEVLAAGGANCGNGGLLSAELYSPATGTWTATGNMTSGNQSTGAALLQNGRVFVVGNDNIYNPSTGSWSSTTPPPTFAQVPLVLLPNGDVFAAGTTQGDLVFNPSTARWTTFAPPPCTTSSQSCESAGALLNTGKVLVAGGPTFVNAKPYPIEETNALAALFDPSTLTWTSTGSMNKSRLGETMTVLLNGQALVAGGDTLDKHGHLVQIVSAELYTP
jgi:N-acetylneuraminic acid mutarotase